MKFAEKQMNIQKSRILKSIIHNTRPHTKISDKAQLLAEIPEFYTMKWCEKAL